MDSGFGLRSQCLSTSHGIIFASPEERGGHDEVVEEVADTEIEMKSSVSLHEGTEQERNNTADNQMIVPGTSKWESQPFGARCDTQYMLFEILQPFVRNVHNHGAQLSSFLRNIFTFPKEVRYLALPVAMVQSFAVSINTEIQLLLMSTYGASKRNPKTHLSVTDVEVINMNVCVVSHSGGTKLFVYIGVSQTVTSVVPCFFAVAQFIRHSREMHKALCKWQPNRYMKLLVQESILYFIVVLTFDMVDLLLGGTSTLLSGTTQIVSGIFSAFTPFILVPRLIISVREFHSHYDGEHIDSGFGLRSQRFSTSHEIMFASPEDQDEGVGAVEEVARVVVE
ncbi:hypothetical protein BU15DRAFT_67586 [Melanogaster broomeanus]|nr:hypothetical protein BU15DRAFT_67586 [Melanogaster broomeanus]